MYDVMYNLADLAAVVLSVKTILYGLCIWVITMHACSEDEMLHQPPETALTYTLSSSTNLDTKFFSKHSKGY